jgi:hypothetical protein
MLENRPIPEGIIPLHGVPGYYANREGGVFREIGFGVLISVPTRICLGYRYMTTVDKHGNRLKDYRVARLICRTFNGEAARSDDVCRHLNDVKTDDRAENLAWGTFSENWHDSIRNGTREIVKGEKHGMCKLIENDIIDILCLLSYGAHGKQIAKCYQVSPATISLIKNNKIWRCYAR